MNKRIIHRRLGYALCIPLLLTATTGFLYKILLVLFGVEKERIKFLLKIHQMSFLFSNSEVFYTFLLGVSTVALVVFGYSMIYNPLFGSRRSVSFRKIPQSVREYHHRYASVIFVLLLFMALTGSIYRFSRNAIGMEKSKVGWILSLHDMSFLPDWFSVIWISFVYVSILSIILSGIRLLPIVNKLFQSSNTYQILISSQPSSSSSSSSSSSHINPQISSNENVNNSNPNNQNNQNNEFNNKSSSLSSNQNNIQPYNSLNLSSSNGDDDHHILNINSIQNSIGNNNSNNNNNINNLVNQITQSGIVIGETDDEGDDHQFSNRYSDTELLLSTTSTPTKTSPTNRNKLSS